MGLLLFREGYMSEFDQVVVATFWNSFYSGIVPMMP